jgi:hypothetical protein
MVVRLERSDSGLEEGRLRLDPGGPDDHGGLG